MFESSVERAVIVTGIILWFVYGWYLNERLRSVYAKLDSVLDQLDGLRNYLYEIDRQFDNERESLVRYEKHLSDKSGGEMFSGQEHLELIRDKEAAGKRTLHTHFYKTRGESYQEAAFKRSSYY